MRSSKITVPYTRIPAVQQHVLGRRFLRGYSSLFYKHAASNTHISWTKTTSSLALTLPSKTSKSETALLGPRHHRHLSFFALRLLTTEHPALPYRSRRTAGRSPATQPGAARPPARSVPAPGGSRRCCGGLGGWGGDAMRVGAEGRGAPPLPPVLTHPSRQVPVGQAPAHRLPLVLQQREGGSQPVALPPPVASPAQPQRQPQQHPAAAQPQVPRQVDGTEPQQRPRRGREQQPRQGARPPAEGGGVGAGGSRGIHGALRSRPPRPPPDSEGSPLPSAPSPLPQPQPQLPPPGGEARPAPPGRPPVPAASAPPRRAMAPPSERAAKHRRGKPRQGAQPPRQGAQPPPPAASAPPRGAAPPGLSHARGGRPCRPVWLPRGPPGTGLGGGSLGHAIRAGKGARAGSGGGTAAEKASLPPAQGRLWFRLRDGGGITHHGKGGCPWRGLARPSRCRGPSLSVDPAKSHCDCPLLSAEGYEAETTCWFWTLAAWKNKSTFSLLLF